VHQFARIKLCFDIRLFFMPRAPKFVERMNLVVDPPRLHSLPRIELHRPCEVQGQPFLPSSLKADGGGDELLLAAPPSRARRLGGSGRRRSQGYGGDDGTSGHGAGMWWTSDDGGGGARMWWTRGGGRERGCGMRGARACR
jgi:hypothetical protein